MTKAPIATLGIDLDKNSCSLAGMDASGAVVLRKRMTREGLIKFAGELPACVVVDGRVLWCSLPRARF